MQERNSSMEEIQTIVDLQRYPIHDTANPEIQSLIARCQAELDAVGCSLVEKFILPESLARMCEEATRLLPRVHWVTEPHNPYFSPDDSSLPADHPVRTMGDRNSGFIGADLLASDSDLNLLYDWQPLTDFVGACLGVSPIYRFADPLARNPYSVMRPDDRFPWHFDGNEFTITVLVQAADEGGIFEYAPDIRTPTSENFDAVAKVLHGSRDGVHSLDLRPGDMQIFKGRYSMHRVTQVKGKANRIIAGPSFVRDPVRVHKPVHAKQVYGRALPIHYEQAAEASPDALTD